MRAISIALLIVLSSIPAFAQPSGTRINIVNADGTGEGFNDPAPATPVGGNPGTTVGEQRLIAFQYAADLWAALIDSPVEIKVQAFFDPLECSSDSAVLGSAGPRSIFAGFDGAPLADTWYVGPLANKLAGEDLDPTEPEIRARFNSSLNGSANCAGGSSWYYGLDNNPGPNQTDLVVVVLHELGHGLGFLTATDKDTGEFPQGRPDIYSRFLFDNTIGASWPQMTNAQRAASATNDGNLVWIGPNAVAAAPSFLGPTPVLVVTEPGSIKGEYSVGLASFGGEITVGGVSSRIVAAEDAADGEGPATTDACTTILNPSALAGNIALVDRGECTFVTKALNVQGAGAVAVIIANNVPGGPQGMSGDDESITIPVISISQQDGAAIRAALGSPARATIRLDPQNLAGTDSMSRPKMYAPADLEEGSSVSHWDTSAEPDLLMEPSISNSLGHGVDLSRDLFSDIGWFSDAVIESTLRHFVLNDRDRDGRADPGDTIRMVLSIQNNGETDARGVVFDLALPNGLTVVPGSVEGGTVVDEQGRLTVELGSLGVGDQVTVTFDLRVNPSLPPTSGSFALQGAIFGTNIETAVTDDPSTVEPDDPTVIVISHTALRAYKTVQLVDDQGAEGELSGGDRLRYYILVTNNSAGDLSGVTVVDPLDPNVDIVPGSAGIGSGSERGTVVEGNQAGARQLVVSFSSIPAGTSVEIGFDVVVRAGVDPSVRVIANQAEISTAGIVVVTDDPSTRELGDATLVHFPSPRRRAVRSR